LDVQAAGGPENAYRPASNAHIVGNWAFLYLTRWANQFAKVSAAAYRDRVSPYSMASPYEWFAEQYTEYRRQSVTGTPHLQRPGVPTYFDDLGRRAGVAPSAAGGSAPHPAPSEQTNAASSNGSVPWPQR